MTRTAALWTAGALATLLALTSTTAGAHSSGAATVTPGSIPAPAGYKTVIDDLGVISVAVPEAWVVDTTPQEVIGAPSTPRILAGPTAEPPGCEGCGPLFSSPSLSISVGPYEVVEQPDGPSCTYQQVAPYDDGRFQGYGDYYTERPGIGGTTAPGSNTVECDGIFESVRASQADAFTVELTLWLWGAGDPEPVPPTDEAMAIFDNVLATFEWTGTPYDQAVGAAALPPAQLDDPQADPTALLWPYGTFADTPELGSEPVRGSGCGGDASIGDVIPDGLWFGYVTPGDGTAGVDLACVYFGETAREILAEGDDTVIDDTNPDFVVVNNSERQRTVPDAAHTVLWGVADETGACRPSGAWGFPDPGLGADFDRYAQNLAWVRIDGGELVWLFYGCDTGFTVGG